MAPAAPPDGTDPTQGPEVHTVSEVNAHVRDLLQSDPSLQDIWVQGELSNVNRSRAGHMYFTVKDEDAELECVFFSGQNKDLDFEPEDGMEVLARGDIGLYEERGNYQLYVEELHPQGEGDLYLRFLQLKERLQEEGLFDEARKQALPDFPKRIGIVTSGEGAALQDIVDVVTRRFPPAELLLRPVRVQGEPAAGEIAEAVDLFDETTDVDVLVLGRGGGSLEDLWAFNEEVVARAIARSSVPVIAAVGHETDFTIADFVADRRAPTPSAAGEIAVPDGASLEARLDEARRRLRTALRHRVQTLQQQADEARRRLPRALRRRAEAMAQRTDEAERGLERAMRSLLEDRRRDVAEAARLLESLSPGSVLERGYAVAEDPETGDVVASTREVQIDDPLRVRLRDGELGTRIAKVMHDDDDG
jgi:exodeoxyribonuclease VII large subunit